MKAIQLFGPRDVRLVDTEKPQTNPGSALVQVKSCVLCGSDVHIWDGRHGPPQYPYPFGHETAGTVVEVGDGVGGLSVGDRVTWYLDHGSLCEYFEMTPSTVAVAKLPEHLTWEEGANLQLLCAVVRGVANADPQPGQRVLVLGCGAVGLSVMQLALAMGASEAVAAELSPFRRDMALGLGAAGVVDPSEAGWQAGLGEFDIVFDCMDEDHTESRDTLDLALRLLKPHGFCSIVGISSRAKPLDTSTLVYKGIRMVGAYHDDISECRRLMAMCCQWVADGTIRVSDYVTDRFPMAETQSALETAASRAEGMLKVAVSVGGE